MGNRERICRLCSQKCVQNFKNIVGNVKEAVEILLPKINLAVSDAPVMCTNCAKTLQKCFNFKLSCLSRHRSIVSCVNTKDNMTTNLKYLHLINEDKDNANGLQDPTTCGLCTKPSNNCSSVSLDREEIKMMLRDCFPELVLSIIKICAPCHESLASCFQFITKCLIIEEKIQKYDEKSSINDDGIRELNRPPRVSIQLEQIFCDDGVNSDGHEIFVEMVDQYRHYLEQFMSEDMSCCQEEDNIADVIKEESKFLEETVDYVKQESQNLARKEDLDFNNEEQFTPENLLVLKEESNKLDMVKMEETSFDEEEKKLEYESNNCIEIEEQKLKNLQFTPKIPSMVIELNQIEIIKPDETLHEGREAANDKTELKHENFLENENQKFNSLPHFTSNNILNCEEDCTKFDVSKIKGMYSEKAESEAERENKYLATVEEQKYDLNDEVDIKPDLQNFDRFEDDFVSPEFEADPSKPCITNMSVHKSISDVKNKRRAQHKGPSEVTMYKCDSCSYQTRRKHSIKPHSLLHKDPSEVTMYNCDSCTFQTKHKKGFKIHILTHKDPSELTMYKCNSCSFQAKHKLYLKRHHLRKHNKESSRVTMYNCEYCFFQTKCKTYLTSHLLKHKDPSEVTMYKCNSCLYQAKRKCSLVNHMLKHKDLSEVSEVVMYKCNSCSYQTKYIKSLKMHLQVHKDPSKVIMYKCDSCSYQTIYMRSLKIHLQVHKDPSEIKMHKCDSCSYQTKHKSDLKRHLLIHAPEAEMYKCDSCSYQTNYKKNLKIHLLVHMDPSNVKMYKCDSCSYQAKYKSGLKRHLLIHAPEAELYKCDSCSYRTNYKKNLKIHLLVHMDPSKVKMHKCDSCSYQTKHKSDLKGHLLIHAPEAEMYKCDSCSYQTNYKKNLKIHLLVHMDPSKVKMYKCDYCSHQTKRKGDLKQHVLRLHKDSSEITT